MIEVVPAKRFHCGQMARHMRLGHRRCLERMGLDPHRITLTAFMASEKAHSVFIDGKLAAMYGIAGSVVSPVGWLWGAVTQWGERHPIALSKLARERFTETVAGKLEILATVLGEDDAGQRFATFLGFHAGDGLGCRAWSRKGRRDLIDYISKEPELRLPRGTGYAIRLTYHAEPPC